MKVHMLSAGLAMPGLADWASAQPVLSGEMPWQAAPLVPKASSLLPPNERRRAPLAVRLAFTAGEDAMAGGGFEPALWATVFASSDADTPIIHRIGSALALPTRSISPTDFHNSVHNAAAGYWSIAARCRQPSTSLSAWDESVAAGLVEAAALALADGLDVLLVAYDIPPPEPLAGCRAITEPAAVAFALCAEAAGRNCLATLELTHDRAGVETPCIDPALEALRRSNPAARALPLLEALARQVPAVLTLPAVDGGLRVTLSSA